MQVHQTSTYHCLSCGSVVHVAPGADAPRCCGNAMVEAAKDTASERDLTEQQAASHCETKPPVVKGRLRPY